MSHWKFLRPGAVSPFTGFAWPAPGEWVHEPAVRACRQGWHACRIGDLPYWLTEELWEVELAGTVAETRTKVVASRARLVSRVVAWTPVTALRFGVACTGRVAAHAADELRDGGLAAQANRLAGVADRVAAASDESTVDSPLWAELDALAGLAGDLAEQAHSRGLAQAERLCGFASDAVTSTRGDPVALVAYIAARAANHRSRAGTPEPYLAERAWQSAWLTDQLGLSRG
jgi:hypothetical protein